MKRKVAAQCYREHPINCKVFKNIILDLSLKIFMHSDGTVCIAPRSRVHIWELYTISYEKALFIYSVFPFQITIGNWLMMWSSFSAQTFKSAATTHQLPLFINRTMQAFSIKNRFISNLVLDTPKFKKLLEVQGKGWETLDKVKLNEHWSWHDIALHLTATDINFVC